MTVSWIPADWPLTGKVIAGTTFRTGGVSQDEFDSLNLAAHVGDDPDAVASNRRQLQFDCDLPSEPLWLRQVHGTTVVIAPHTPAPGEADAIVTREPDNVCAILTADCLPVLFAADDGTELGAAHAGWRGLCAGVLEETVAAMHTSPERILAWFGPAISQPAFEVGPKVREQFVDQDKTAEVHFSENDAGRWQADLYGLATRRLQNCGVTRVFGGGLCTHADQRRFFSYRRDGRCGRMASFIFREPDA